MTFDYSLRFVIQRARHAHRMDPKLSFNAIAKILEDQGFRRDDGEPFSPDEIKEFCEPKMIEYSGKPEMKIAVPEHVLVHKAELAEFARMIAAEILAQSEQGNDAAQG